MVPEFLVVLAVPAVPRVLVALAHLVAQVNLAAQMYLHSQTVEPGKEPRQ